MENKKQEEMQQEEMQQEEMQQEEMQQKQLSLGKRRAMNLLSRRDYSRKELTDKLKKDMYGEKLIEEILQYLDSYHYLDDIRYAGVIIRGRMQSKSRREIVCYLKTKGISEEDIEEAMSIHYHIECDEQEQRTKEASLDSPEQYALKNQLRKYRVTKEILSEMSYADKQKLAARFYRKGYSQDIFRKELGI